MKQECIRLWNAPSVDGSLSARFSIKELFSVIKHIKTGKVQCPHNIAPPFLKHCSPKFINWLSKFFSACLKHQSIPKIWRKATVVALPKPHKPSDGPRSYRPISLLCVPYKILKRLLLAKLDLVFDPQLPEEQASFRRGYITIQQIINPTSDIEDSFERANKAGVILADLIAACDTVWHQGLILKLFQ